MPHALHTPFDEPETVILWFANQTNIPAIAGTFSISIAIGIWPETSVCNYAIGITIILNRIPQTDANKA